MEIFGKLAGAIGMSVKDPEDIPIPDGKKRVYNLAKEPQTRVIECHSGTTLKVHHRNFENLEKKYMEKVEAIVLHNTDSTTAKSTLNAYKRRNQGKELDKNGKPIHSAAHYLIDKDGSTYQTVPEHKQAWHVGKIKSRCLEEGTCSEKELKNISKAKTQSSLSSLESKKPYPQRYPNNKNSLGIEIVGKFNKKYGPITKKQQEALHCLVKDLQKNHNLSPEDVYRHGKISPHKKPSEASFGEY